MSGDVESVLKDVGLAEDDPAEGGDGDLSGEKGKARGRVWLHCNVGGRVEEKNVKHADEGDEVSRHTEDER